MAPTKVHCFLVLHNNHWLLGTWVKHTQPSHRAALDGYYSASECRDLGLGLQDQNHTRRCWSLGANFWGEPLQKGALEIGNSWKGMSWFTAVDIQIWAAGSHQLIPDPKRYTPRTQSTSRHSWEHSPDHGSPQSVQLALSLETKVLCKSFPILQDPG